MYYNSNVIEVGSNCESNWKLVIIVGEIIDIKSVKTTSI